MISKRLSKQLAGYTRPADVELQLGGEEKKRVSNIFPRCCCIRVKAKHSSPKAIAGPRRRAPRRALRQRCDSRLSWTRSGQRGTDCSPDAPQGQSLG
ncbi:hypothetical protein EYF80_046777 [Liparis tanakae]|uniref:Uncharacterized protein n=1 Tax=Liparis tanakae TaxID=230148 RepID=A0A4Z2FPF4_9TELE|nr:hypothetical protein EYF80_046777 [Liparis tanakae]